MVCLRNRYVIIKGFELSELLSYGLYVPLYNGLILGCSYTARVKEAFIMFGKLGISFIDDRIIKVGFYYPGFKIIKINYFRYAAEEIEHPYMRLNKTLLILTKDILYKFEPAV